MNPANFYFQILTADEKSAAIRRMSLQGFSDYGIAHATGLSVEQIRLILETRTPGGTPDVRYVDSDSGVIDSDRVYTSPPG